MIFYRDLFHIIGRIVDFFEGLREDDAFDRFHRKCVLFAPKNSRFVEQL